MVEFTDRQYVSRYATDTLGLGIQANGAPTDVDGDAMAVSVVSEQTHLEVLSGTAVHVGTGLYEIALTSAATTGPGPYTATWTYEMGGVPQVYETYFQVGESAPDYDRLHPAMKDLVDTVWIQFADLFDSPGGGPNLLTYFQSHYGHNRLAQLLRIAIGRLNTMAQPHQTYTLDGDGGAQFPHDRWGPLLQTALYIEAVKHLVRSYVEQPMFMGSGAVSRLDRRDYMQRWQDVLSQEEAMFKSQLDVFKITHMGLGKPAVLVSGGVYGRYGPTRVAGSVAARPRYWTRFY